MLSVCIITKNEEKNIERCLSSFQNTSFELIVVDTGSTDNTKEAAGRFTSNVYDFEWCDDFATAKNFAISKASNDIVMIIDSDEYIEKLNVSQLEGQIEKHPGQVGRILRRNIFHREGERHENRDLINRIFHKDKFHFEGKIHEQVVHMNHISYETYVTDVVINHSGYDLTEEELQAKSKRNIELLLKKLQDLSEESQEYPYILYQLGKGCYMAKEYEQAVEYFSQGLSYDLDPKLEYVIDMVETYGYALINSGQVQAALMFENIYDAFGDSSDFQFLMGLIYMKNAYFDKAVEEFLKAVKHKACRNVGTNSYSAFYNIGVIYECLGRKKEALHYYRKCGDYEPAFNRVKELV